MVVSINQPACLPWLGYFHRIAISDFHVVLDHVQFEKNSFVNRNRIKTPNGPFWLTVPVQTSGKFGDLAINKLEIAVKDLTWRRKTIENIRQFYRKSRYFDEYFPALNELLGREWKYLNDLMSASNSYFLDTLSIKTPIKYSSSMTVRGVKQDLILNICKDLGATTYLSGPLGRNYIEDEKFRKENIEVKYHSYQHPAYRQMFGDFEPNLSILDLLFNEGPDSRKILMNEL